jgi:hypothetical protein
MDRGLSTASKPRRERGPVIVGLILGGVVMAAVVSLFLWQRISGGLCGSYNFISNDICDEWNVAPPPGDVVPVPSGWAISWQGLDCGSGGCGWRTYVLSPDGGRSASASDYLGKIEELGWSVSEGGARYDDLVLTVDAATDRSVMRRIPPWAVDDRNIFVAVALCGEGSSCASLGPVT